MQTQEQEIKQLRALLKEALSGCTQVEFRDWEKRASAAIAGQFCDSKTFDLNEDELTALERYGFIKNLHRFMPYVGPKRGSEVRWRFQWSDLLDDTSRLDWLENTVDKPLPYGFSAENDAGEKTGETIWEWAHRDECFRSLRAAIDAERHKK